MSYYCRTVKFTFISEFAKKSFISQLNSSVNDVDFERGLIQRIFFDTSENQIVQIFVWPDKFSADKRMKEIGDDLLQNLREANVKIERFEGLISEFSLNPNYKSTIKGSVPSTSGGSNIHTNIFQIMKTIYEEKEIPKFLDKNA